MDYSNIPTGLNVPSQIPLNIKEYVLNETELSNLGTGNNKAFTYHDQMKVVCIEEKKEYIWREVVNGEPEGLITNGFTYPADLPETFGIDYSNKTYNFFLKEELSDVVIKNIGSGSKVYKQTNTDGEKELRTITAVGPLLSVTEKTDEIELEVSESAIETIVEGMIGEPFVLVNKQKTIGPVDYILTPEDDMHTIFVDNATNSVIIHVPTGLPENFSAVFVQKGIGSVFIKSNSGTTVIFPTELSDQIKGKSYWAMIERELDTNNFYLMGALAKQDI